jgi:hypothetical protein
MVTKSDTDTSALDVDALLSQADSLMDEVQASLGEGGMGAAAATQGTGEGSPPTPGASAEAVTAENAIHDMAEEITSSADKADADAIMAMLNPGEADDGNASSALQPDSTAAPATEPSNPSGSTEAPAPEAATTNDSPPAPATGTPAQATSKPAIVAGSTATEEWMNAMPDDQVPSIPDVNESDAQPASQAAEAIRVRSRQAGACLTGLLRHLVRLPIDIVILLDRPFAGLGSGTKSLIGYTAIGTLAIALASWIYGGLRQPL